MNTNTLVVHIHHYWLESATVVNHATRGIGVIPFHIKRRGVLDTDCCNGKQGEQLIHCPAHQLSKRCLLSREASETTPPHGHHWASEESELVHMLQTRYKHGSKLSRPVLNSSHIIKVLFGLSLQKILDFDEKNQVLTTLVWKEYVSKKHKIVVLLRCCHCYCFIGCWLWFVSIAVKYLLLRFLCSSLNNNLSHLLLSFRQ